MGVREEVMSRYPHSAQQPHLGSLSPFLLTCTAYFFLWIPEDPPSRVGALVKCLPVLCLVGLLRTSPGSGSGSRLQVALLFSALRDVFLIWPENFLYGCVACAMAQLLYVRAFGLRPLRPDLLLPIILASLPFSGLLLLHFSSSLVLPLSAYVLALSTVLWRDLCPFHLLSIFLASLPFSGLLLLHLPPDLVLPVSAFMLALSTVLWRGLCPFHLLSIFLASLPFSGLLLLHLPRDLMLPVSAYVLTLSTMLWRGLARGGSARWGTLLFAASDSLLAWHTFIQPLAHGRLLIMYTYYAAQLFITLSAFQSPKLKTDRPGA
ncbi:lysoplasmalogenase TMEM86B isoform X2 [Myotis daubentonii]|uniref:lysoplasmalogenase TMEM86B isoform X2 n=1 Tax=Myotis daubentonii TaxID=98922 RepID=UPI002873D6FF|nr:lysoplasmalogenase TMEM86B isoform X2 [Myotis daubentonii]